VVKRVVQERHYLCKNGCPSPGEKIEPRSTLEILAEI